MRFEGLAYRGHNPRWAFAPASGAGAAVHGGRFNPKGVAALYLALSPEGAFLEATQGFAYKFKPLTLCTYVIDCAGIADLTDGAVLDQLDMEATELSRPWVLDLSNGKRPETWAVYNRLSALYAGIIVPSFAWGAGEHMRNLVLWRWSECGPHRVKVHDPAGDLPKDQNSWSG